MIHPIVGLGHSILRQVAKPVEKDYPGLKELVADMYETMYAADGVGLAAPQINLPIRLVVVGFRPYDEKTETYGEPTEEHTLINPEIVAFGEKKDWFNEGCLSVPDIHEDVLRPTTIRLRWYDEEWNLHDEEIDGLFARVAQHEVDHLEGKVFTDRLSNLKRTMIKRKLNDVVSGRVRTAYRMLKMFVMPSMYIQSFASISNVMTGSPFPICAFISPIERDGAYPLMSFIYLTVLPSFSMHAFIISILIPRTFL